MKRILWALPICLAGSQPVQADDTSTGLLGFLAGGAGSGKTELGDHAGEIESWAIASQSATQASKAVWKEITDKQTSANVLIVNTSAKFSLTPYWMVLDRTESLGKAFDTAKHNACDAPKNVWSTTGVDTSDAGSTKSDSPIPAIAGLLLSDKKIDDITFTPTEAFWLNALIATRPVAIPSVGAINEAVKSADIDIHAYLLSSLNPNPKASVAVGWSNLVDRAKREIATCTAGAEKDDKSKGGDKANKDAKAKAKKAAEAKAALAAVGDMISETDKAFKAAEKDTQSILEQASQLEPLINGKAGSGGDLLILRTNLEKVGATVVTTKNLLTMFGYPAVTLSGGLIGTFSVERVQPNNRGPSDMIASGNIACTGPRRPLGQWHGESLKANECFVNGEPYPAQTKKLANR